MTVNGPRRSVFRALALSLFLAVTLAASVPSEGLPLEDSVVCGSDSAGYWCDLVLQKSCHFRYPEPGDYVYYCFVVLDSGAGPLNADITARNYDTGEDSHLYNEAYCQLYGNKPACLWLHTIRHFYPTRPTRIRYTNPQWIHIWTWWDAAVKYSVRHQPGEVDGELEECSSADDCYSRAASKVAL